MLESIRETLHASIPYITLFGTSVNVLAQVAGLAALALSIWGYFQPKLPFFIIAAATSLCFVIEGCFLFADSNTLSNIIGNSIVTLRNVLIVCFLAKWKKEPPAWLAIPFLVLYWGVLLLVFPEQLDAWYTFLPPVSVSIYTVCAMQKNYYVVKTGALIWETAFLIYHPITGAYVGLIRQALLVTIVVVSMIQMYRTNKHAAQEATPLVETPTC